MSEQRGIERAAFRLKLGDVVNGEYSLALIEPTGFTFLRLKSKKTFKLTSKKLNSVWLHVKCFGYVYARQNGASGISATSAVEQTCAHGLGLKRDGKKWVKE